MNTFIPQTKSSLCIALIKVIGIFVLVGSFPAAFAKKPHPHAETFLDLRSPEQTVKTQITLLQENKFNAFRLTFLENVRPSITREVFQACRARLEATKDEFEPDWEGAESETVDNHLVKRVTMYGHESTGFHLHQGQWLADHQWCLPNNP